MKIKRLNQVLTLVLTIAALMVGQSAWAMSSFTIDASYNSNSHKTTFTITRTGNTTVAETIDWRVVSLSAIAGQHFTVDEQNGYDGTATFSAGISTASVTISEKSPSDNAYKYQNGTERKYRFEVLDKDGSILATKDRTMTTGTSVPSSGLFNEKEITIFTTGTQFTDAGYDQSNNPHYINSSSYYNLSGIAPAAYYTLIGAQLRSTLSLEAREENNGYQYVQILINNTSTCDNRSKCSDGDPGNISLSRYMAGFDHEPSKANTNYATYTFPVTSQPNNCSEVSNAWSNGVTNKLYTQKFNTNCRATDGRLILPVDFEKFVVRFNASGGGSDHDEWLAKNVKAHIQAVDGTAPTVLNNYKVSGGRHQKGNTIYVSVAFSEIVVVTGTPTLNSNWGTLSYVAGSGSNVLTFKGTIDPTDNNPFSVSSYSGTIKDLAGNSFSGSISHNFGTVLDADYAWSTSDFNGLNDGSYEIYTTQDLRHLALMVNSGNNNCSGLTFKQTHDITYTHTTNWNNSSSQEDNYTAIGTDDHGFQGTFDGQDHTISGIRIYRGDYTSADDYQGLFGYISGGTVRGVNLADARITGFKYVGGIAGKIYSCTVKDCTVATDVCIHAVHGDSDYHGGIVGNSQGTVQRCLSRARLTVTDASGCGYYGAIVGYNNNHAVKDCIAIGASVPSVSNAGAIIGYGNISNGVYDVQRNYYRDCTVAGVENATGVGVGYDKNTKSPHDVTANQGAQALYSLTLPAHASLVREPSATLPGTDNATYGNGADIAGVPYAKALSALSLSYDATALTPGFDVVITATQTSSGNPVAVTDNGNHTYTIASMPAADITVTATEVPLISYLDADGNEQSHAGTHIVSETTSYGNAENAVAWYYVDGNVNYSSDATLTFNDQQVNIILCDGATLKNSSNGSNTFINVVNGSLAIYGQSGGTGSISCNKNTRCIDVKSNIDFNGGTVSATASQNQGIYTPNGSITVRRGKVTARGSNYAIWSKSGDIIIHGGTVDAESEFNAIYAKNNLTINGGTVTANATNTTESYYSGLRTNSGDVSILGGHVTTTGQTGIVAGFTDYNHYGTRAITLGCATPTGRIYASSYACSTLNIADGQTLTDCTATYSGSVNASDINGKTLCPDLWGVASGNDGSTAAKAYTITTTAGLDQLATLVNSGNDFSGKYFRLGNNITYNHTTAWDDATSQENNYTAIGNNSYSFKGIFDGQGHTVSGIRIYTVNTSFQGIFGITSGGTIRNVILADARITARNDAGGIVGQLSRYNDVGSIIENCRVGSDVTIHAAGAYATAHGGVVGKCNHSTIRGCVSAATLTAADGTPGIGCFGGIVGVLEGDMSDCLALGASMTAISDNGAIAGRINSGTKTNCYYRDCTVGNATHQTDAYTISAGTNVTMASAGTADATYDYDGIQRYGDALYYDGVLYAPANANVSLTLGYSGEVGTGYHVEYSTTAGTINGSTLTMPAEDVTVSATIPINSYTVRFYKNDGGEDYIDQTFTYGVAQTLSASAFSSAVYHFTGWNTAPDGSGTTYTDKQEVSNLTATHGAVFNLYAQWEFVALECPLTLEAIADGTIKVDNRKSGMQYSKNGGNKQAVPSSITVSAGDIVQFYGNGTSIASYGGDNVTKIQCTADCYIYGNIMSLVDETGFATNTTLTGTKTFRALFYKNTHIKNHSNNTLVLPATTLAEDCYDNMFFLCTNLTAAPALPATTLAENCYSSMFSSCTNLAAAPALPATTLAENCYGGMFSGCTSLTAAPKLPATTLADHCYESMFYGCTSLAAAPALPATTLAVKCYYQMFLGCTNLTTAPALPATMLALRCYHSMFENTGLTAAPALPATTLVKECYRQMFSGCTNLTAAPELPATTLEELCYTCMFKGCTSLTAAPALPATTLAKSCYTGMFDNCTSLTAAPALPATTLTEECYNGMFSDCTGLTAAPALPATTLTKECYASMFKGCTNLNYVICMATDRSATDCTYNWLFDVASSGTFVKAAGASWESGEWGIPDGWTVVETPTLYDDADNSAPIKALSLSGLSYDVTLQGRTLSKSGAWNTLCLPFNVDLTADGCPLAGATVKELDAENSNLAANGKLTLKFKDASSIVAGKPYIVKWETTGNNIVDPVFTGVTVNATAPTAVTFANNANAGGACQFVGQYSPFSIDDNNIDEIIMLGSGSTLGYSKNPRSLRSFRCHFEIPTTTNAPAMNSYVIDFGEGEQTGIISGTDFTDSTAKTDVWYTLDGRKLDKKPTQKGMYIMNGRKVVIK